MRDEVHIGTASAVALVVSTAQPDDSGSETFDRYDWQAAMAAAHGLRLLYDALSKGPISEAPFCRIICELHEDWVACVGDDAELISAKHRDRSFGAYTTVGMLVTKGGLGHLFGRWCALQEKPTCRLVTTAGLQRTAKDLMDAATTLRSHRLSKTAANMAGAQQAAVTAFVRCLLDYKAGEGEAGLPVAWTGTADNPVTAATQAHTDQAMRFLAILDIDCTPPLRKEIGHAAPTMFVAPVLSLMGIDVGRAADVWASVLAVFRERMKDAGPRPDGALPDLMQWRPTNDAGGGERELVSRIVAITDIAIVIQVVTTAVTPAYEPPPALPLTRLGIKMAKGGCADTSIERAEQLRQDYSEFWRAKIDVDHSARFEQDANRRKLHRLSDEATHAVRQQDQLWGTPLWIELQIRLAAMPTAGLPVQMDEELALGGVCDLTSRCQVWFSERFDVDAALAEAQQGRAA
ncbi:hypothetical protein AB0H43_12380 [Hamadaea sp. NPDC050747]|uniref:hypothetical protein n=1 Tax=Hamadaea sp. NPDC050747 TaxID=3155789 RepID=UPI0033E96353